MVFLILFLVALVQGSPFSHDQAQNYTKIRASSIDLSNKSSLSVLVTQSSAHQPYQNVNRQQLKHYIKMEQNDYSFPLNHHCSLHFSKLIKYLAMNDYKGFFRDKPVFTSFKPTFRKIQKNGIHYLPHYIIYFGATNFLRCLNSFVKIDFEGAELMKAFRNLIQTKDLSVIVKIMKADFSIPEAALKEISQAIKDKYPILHCFDFFFFEFYHVEHGIESNILKILHAENEKEKLDETVKMLSKLFAFSKISILHFGYRRFLELPKLFPEYFVKLNKTEKLMFAILSLIQNDVAAFVKIVELFPEALLITIKGKTLFDYAVKMKRKDFYPFFLSIVPELLTIPKQNGISLLESIILDDNVEVIKELESAGFSSEAKIIHNLNAVQLALELLSPKLFNYFVGKYGNEKITSMLLEIYGSREKIFRALQISFASRIEK